MSNLHMLSPSPRDAVHFPDLSRLFLRCCSIIDMKILDLS